MSEAAPEVADNADPAPAPQDNAEPVATPAAAPAKEPAKAPADDWHASLPEDIRDHASLRKFTSAEALAKSYVNLEKTLGTDKLPVPKSEDDKEGWDKIYKVIGRPDEPAGYTFQKIDLPEGFAYNTEREAAYRDVAHKLGLSVKQAQELRDWTIKEMASDFGNIEQDTEAAKLASLETLRSEWGNALPQKLSAAQSAVRQVFGEEFGKYLDQTGLGNDVTFVKGMARLAEKIGADKGIAGEGFSESTPGQLDAQIAEFRAKNAAALQDKYHVEHASRVAQLEALYKKRYPEPAA